VAVANAIEQSDAVVITGNRLSIDDAGARSQAGQPLNDQWETIGEIIAGTAVEPHLRAVLSGDDPKTIMLNLMQPFAARGQLVGSGWETRRNEPGRESR